jgi:hypothetical protein
MDLVSLSITISPQYDIAFHTKSKRLDSIICRFIIPSALESAITFPVQILLASIVSALRFYLHL